MRKTADVTIDTEGRDKGKVFRITEMPATQQEAWGLRAVQAMTRGGLDIPENVAEAGLPAMIATGLHGLFKANYADVAPLLAEMMGCVTVIVDAMPLGRPLVENDIEEVQTRIRLRDETLALHLGFSPATVLQAAVALNKELAAQASLNTSTSRQKSAPSSRRASPR
jgi:hypothetical protein